VTKQKPSTSTQSTHSSANATSNKNGEKLEVTVIPVDDLPYSKMINMPSLTTSSSAASYAGYSGSASGSNGAATFAVGNAAATQMAFPSLKDLFQKEDSLWKSIFGHLVEPGKTPLFSIFRKKIERKIDIPTVSSNQEMGKFDLH